MTTIAVTRLPHGEGLPLPAYATEGAAGMDLLAAVTSPLVIPAGQAGRWCRPGSRSPCRPGMNCRCGHVPAWRCSHGIVLPNSPGTIDEDYRGEMQVIVMNAGAAPFTVERGMRIAQAVLAPVLRARWAEVAELPDATTRDVGGFGSTGTTNPQK